jgi:hypothetical protein
MMDLLYLTDLMVRWLTYVFIDDFGIFQLIEATTEMLDEELRATAGKAREFLNSRGFAVHKEARGEGLGEALGMTITGRPYIVRVSRKKARMLRGATRHLLRMKAPRPSAVECLMGSWTWNLQACRWGFCIPDVVYKYITKCREAGPKPLWGMVKTEVSCLLFGSPLFRSGLELKWWPVVFAGDASGPGYGVVQTLASPEEIRRESRWCSTGKWPVAAVEREYRLSEETVWEAPDDRIWHMDARERTLELRDQEDLGDPQVRLLLVGGNGERALGELRRGLLEAGGEALVPTEVITMQGKALGGLGGEDALAKLWRGMRRREFGALICLPGARTWKGAGSTEVELRSKSQPWGVKGLRGRAGTEVKHANQSLMLAVEAIKELGPSGFPVLVMQRGSGSEASEMWRNPELEEALGRSVDEARKDSEPDADWKRAEQRNAVRLADAEGRQTTWELEAVNVELPGEERECPLERVCRAVLRSAAGAHGDGLEELRKELEVARDPRTVELDEEVRALGKQVKRRVKKAVPKMGARPPPSVHESWDDLRRWKLTLKGKWKREENIGIQELRVISMVCRRQSMQRAGWRHKVLILTDSAVALGCVAKGRSSQPALLRQMRTIGGLAMALEIIPKCRWIESERNPSDGPSRGVGIGAEAETMLVHSVRARQRKERARELGR